MDERLPRLKRALQQLGSILRQLRLGVNNCALARDLWRLRVQEMRQLGGIPPQTSNYVR